MDQVSVSLRFQVFTRDGFRCVYCGRAAVDGAELHADHAISRKRGGRATLANLVTSCVECNLGKSAQSITRRPLTALAEGAISRTRLFVVTLGLYMRCANYGATYRYMLQLGWPEEILPPRRPRMDGRLWTQCNEPETSWALRSWYAEELDRVLTAVGERRQAG